MTQLDSIYTSEPIQVLRLLPKDTTTVELPTYYREGQFSGDTLFYQEVEGEDYGAIGTPPAYMATHDNLITLLLIGCLLFYNFAISHFWGFISRQTEAIFYSRKAEQIKGTGIELQLMWTLLATSCLMCSILYYLYVTTFVSQTYILPSEYLLLAIIFAAFVVYHALRFLSYHIVNITFFSSQQNRKFLTTSLFLSDMAGVLLLPGVFLLAYFNFSAVPMIIYAGFVLFFVKILSFYKSYDIFFKRNAYFLQNILYFCALEIVPLVMLVSGLSAIVDILKVN